MTRTALARQYRPRRFGEMATQEHVSTTLRTAVAKDRVAHAYLFCGPRGVGKTTAARVLAMALNCPERTEQGEPCGSCESCERIWAGRTSLDVVEIDAASNRGVDDARELRERAMYAPTDEQRFKVYIIDEAHMLTREAWNALLKILEEPPPRVIFVFATTEPQKIQQAAPPILSRCQRFDFRRIGVPAIVTRLEEVAGSEGVDADPEALLLIARRADGGMRDALSLLDQLLSFAEGSLDADDVRRVLGLVGDEVYIELFHMIADRRVGDVFRFVQRLLDEGYDLNEFYRGLADAIRVLLVIRFEDADAASVADDVRAEFAACAERFSTGDLLRMLAQVAELDAEGRFRKSGNPRILIESLLLRFAHLSRTVAVEDLLRAAGGSPSAGDDVVREPRPPATRGARARDAADDDGDIDGGGNGAGGRAPGSEGGGAVDGNAESGPTDAPGPGTADPSGAVPDDGGAGPSPAGEARSSPAGKAPRYAAPSAAVVRERAPVGRADEAFRTVMEQEPGILPGLGVFLRAAEVLEPEPGRVEIRLPPGPGLERLHEDARARTTLAQAIGQRLGRDIELVVDAAGGADTPQERLTPDRVKSDRLARLSGEDPTLRRAVDEWDLEIVE